METVPNLSVFKAKEALAFYEDVFGAKIEDIIYMKEDPTYKDSPYKDLVMHSRLIIGETFFYINDQLDDHVQPVGRNVQFCINVFTKEEFDTIYNKLKGRSTLERDVTEEYWHALSFSVKDPYEIVWHIFYIMEVKK